MIHIWLLLGISECHKSTQVSQNNFCCSKFYRELHGRCCRFILAGHVGVRNERSPELHRQGGREPRQAGGRWPPRNIFRRWLIPWRAERSLVRLCRTRPSHYLLLIPTTPFSLWRYLNFSACKLRRVNESPFFVHTSLHC